MFLLDTSVVFALGRPLLEGADPNLADWARRTPREDLFISALTLLEIDAQAGRLMRKDRAGGSTVRDWLGEQTR